MKIKGNKIMFLLGAGASAPMGIPTMKKFTKDFVEFGEKTLQKREEIGYWLRDIKRVSGKGFWDLERLLTLIRQAKNIDSDVNVDLLRKYLFRGNSKNKQKFDDWTESIGYYFAEIERVLLQYIRTRCLNPNIDRGKKIYSKIYSISTKYILELFTTNYDPILETVSVKLGYEYSDGFYPDRGIGAFKWDGKLLGSERINIYKLHGSVTWYKKNEHVLNFPADISKSPGIDTLMIYPTELKEILNPPFSQLHRKLEENLFDSNLCIVVGHSFRDEYIRNLFMERLKEKNFKIYFICGRYSKSLKKHIFGQTNMVSPITEKFENINIPDFVKKHS